MIGGPVRAAAAAITLGALLLAGCGADQQYDSAGDTSASAPRQGSSEGGAAAKRAGGAGAGEQGTDVTKVAPTRPGDAGPDAARAIVYTADLRVRAKDVDAGATRAKQFVQAAGGHVANESSSTRPASAMIAFRIPAEHYNTVLDQLAKQVGNRLSLRQQAEDVTAEVADVDSRVKSAQSALASFRKLLNRADTIGEVLNVEQEISRREADLESLQARQKTLGQQTRFATVTMHIEGPERVARTEKREGGFVGGIKAGWSAFTTLLSGLALVVGWLLPFTPILALIAAIAFWLRRRAHRARPQAPSQQTPAQQTPSPQPPPQ